MANLETIRDAIKTTIEAGVTTLHCYDTVPNSPNVLPAVVIVPFTTDFDVAFGRGLDTYEIDLMVLVSESDAEIGQDSLDSYVTGAGSSSIRQTIFTNRTLGLTNTDAHISQMVEYGMRFPAAGFDHLGARLRMIVHTIGSS